MKKQCLAILLCFALCLSLIPAAAASETEQGPSPIDEPSGVVNGGWCGDDLSFELDGDGVLTVYGTGDMWDRHHATGDWDRDRNGWSDGSEWDNCGWDGTGLHPIKDAVFEEGVTSIGAHAFCNCYQLESVTIPDSMRRIADCAFLGCYRLQNMTIPEGVTSVGRSVFCDCDSLTGMTIPDSVKSIGGSAFTGCDKLQSVTIGKGLEEVPDRIFDGCIELQEVVFRGSAPRFQREAFVHAAFVAYYPADDESWTESVRQSYGGFVLWVPDDGPRITLTAYDNVNDDSAQFGGGGTLGGGVCAFTLSSYADRAVLVALKDGDGYTALPCTTDADGVHSYTLPANGDTEMVLALKGDVNLDGVLRASDGTMLKRAILGSYAYDEDLEALCKLVADLNGDGTIKASEGTQIARSLLGTFTIPW